jgi:hypothetical protein
MLDLLVLGQIPGTNFQLTFIEIALSCYGLLLLKVWLNRQLYARMDRRYLQLTWLRYQATKRLDHIDYSAGSIDSPYNLSSSRTYFSASEMPGRADISFNREKYLAIKLFSSPASNF